MIVPRRNILANLGDLGTMRAPGPGGVIVPASAITYVAPPRPRHHGPIHQRPPVIATPPAEPPPPAPETVKAAEDLVAPKHSRGHHGHVRTAMPAIIPEALPSPSVSPQFSVTPATGFNTLPPELERAIYGAAEVEPTGFWDGLSTGAKIGVGAGGAFALFLLARAVKS